MIHSIPVSLSGSALRDRDQSNDFFLIFQFFFFMRDSETISLGTFDCIVGSLKFS